MDQANRQLTSVNDFFVAWIVRTRARPSLSRPQREKGGGVTQKPGLSSLHCSLLTRLRRSSGAGTGSAATNDLRSVSLSGVVSLSGNKPCETLTPGWPWHRPGLPRTLMSQLSTISISQSSDLMNNTPITGNNALSLAAARPGLDPRLDGDREIWNCLSSEINGRFLSVLRNSFAQKVHRSVPIHICSIVF